MKSEFKAKFLQNLISKKKGAEGFTLIELLVVIIIVGVLAAIALPSFLNQIGKARGSEAKTNIGTINRSQQAYRLETTTFAPALTNLDARITGKFYTYVVAGADTAKASVQATASGAGVAAELKKYSGAVAQTGDIFGQVICESTAVNGTLPDPIAPATAATRGTCTNGTILD